MTSKTFIGSAFAVPLVLGFFIPCAAQAETVTLDDGTTCTIIESTSSAGNTTSSVTAGGGKVTSSTTIGGNTTTTGSAAGSASSSASSSVSGTAGNEAFSTASVTRPDGSIVTRRSDGTCDITKPTR